MMHAKTDYKYWKVKQHLYGKSALPHTAKNLLASGIHSFKQNGQLTLDFLSLGFDDPKKTTGHYLVAFQGAVSEKARDTSAAPYFAGVGLSVGLNIPLLTVSDPSLTLNEKLTLGWYAGNEYISNIYSIVAKVVDSITERTGLYPVILGGSGGGFAAIQTMAQMQTPATCITWNPTTSISNSYFDKICYYLQIAHPRIADQITENTTPAQLTAILDKFLPIHRLPPPTEIQSKHKIVILQNRRDHFYLTRHSGPWLTRAKFAPINDTSFINERGNILFFPGDWGVGHIPPSLPLIKNLITQAGTKTNIAYLAASLLSNDENASKTPVSVASSVAS